MERIETLTFEMLDAYRSRARVDVSTVLRDRIVEFARQENPYFEKLLGSRKIPFDEIPLLTKSIVRENFDRLVTPGVALSRRELSATSGSVGQPMTFLRDVASFPVSYAARRFLKWFHGIPENAVTVWCRLRADVAPPPGWHISAIWGLNAERMTEELDAWRSFGRYWIYGQASAVEQMAHLIQTKSLDVLPPLCIVGTSDQLSDHGRSMIGQAFKCPVHSWYGSKEIDPSLAGTLPNRPDAFIWNGLRGYLEVLDSEDRPVPPGEIGRMVVTDPHNEAFPLIRYDTEDLAKAPYDSHLAFPTLEGLVGRASEMFELKNGRMISGSDIGYCLFVIKNFEKDISLYQCAQTAPDAVELRVVWRRPPSDNLVSSVEEAMALAVGEDTAVKVAAVDALERMPSDKRAIVIPLKKPAFARGPESVIF